MEPEMCRAVKACRHLTLPAAPSRTPATRVPYLERCASWISSTVASPTASRAAWTPPVDSTREMAATRLAQVTQKLVGISRVCSFSITLGNPNGQRAATRNGRGLRPSCRATASKSLELSAIGFQPSALWSQAMLHDTELEHEAAGCHRADGPTFFLLKADSQPLTAIVSPERYTLSRLAGSFRSARGRHVRYRRGSLVPL